MPKKPIDYSQTIIYKLVCKDLCIIELYIGHTTNFIQRKTEHKCKCNKITNKENKSLKYQFIREHGGWDNWDMIEIEKYPCIDSNEARARERYWYEILKPKLNTQKPNRSPKEYRENHIEEIKKYNIDNKEKLKKYRKEQYEKNKDEINKIRKEKKYTCDCCYITIRYCDKARHEKSNKHKTALEMYVKH